MAVPVDFSEPKKIINRPSWLAVISEIKPLPQRQDSTIDQLRDLISVANIFGFYDAADYIRNLISVHTNPPLPQEVKDE